LTIKYLRRESFSFYLPDSLVKDRDHRGSKGASVRRHLFIRAANGVTKGLPFRLPPTASRLPPGGWWS